MSETAPAIFWKIGAQVGLVIWQTRMSPGCSREISSTLRTTRAGPSTTPLDAAKPRLQVRQLAFGCRVGAQFVDAIGILRVRHGGGVPGTEGESDTEQGNG